MGELLQEPAAGLRFVTGEHGKPRLVGDRGSPIEFNLSHSGHLALFGWASGARIGVDIERWRATIDRDALVERWFSEAERGEYFALPMELRQKAFFDGWTRKEAILKADGRGLSMGLQSFAVSLRTGSDNLLLHPPPDTVSLDLRALELGRDLGDSVSAAIAVEADEMDVTVN